MKIYLAGFLATTKEYLPDHLFFKLKKLNRLMSYYDIKEDRSNSKKEFKIIMKDK